MRIVSGRFGGRRLVAPHDEETRPTSEKVREALFSMLGPLSGGAVLDLYAGTGALGLEALSRGADRIVLVESRRAALDALRKNVASLGAPANVAVLEKRVEKAAKALVPHGPFDLVFADPPYASVASGEVALALADLYPGLLAGGAVVVLEHSSRHDPPQLSGLSIDRTRRYGDTSVSFYDLT